MSIELGNIVEKKANNKQSHIANSGVKRYKLGELSDIVRGSSPRPQGDPRYYGGTVPRLMVADLTRDGMYVTPLIDFLTEKGAELSRPMKKGDVVIAVSGNPGLPSILKSDACIHDGFVGLRNLNQDKIYNEYLYYFLLYNKLETKSKAVGAIFKNLTTDQIKEIEIPLPDLKSQQEITLILEQTDKARQQRKAANALTDQFLQSSFLSLFGDPVKNEKGWERVKCEDLFEMKLGKMLSAKNYKGTHLRKYLRNVNVKWGEIDLSDVKEMDFDEREFELYRLKRGDILVCEGGEVGRTAILNFDLENHCYQNALHRLRIKDFKKINPHYFSWYMYIGVDRGLIEKETISVTIQHFTQEKFKKLEIYLPPLSLQQQFAGIVAQAEALRKKQKESEKELETLFQALLQKYFG